MKNTENIIKIDIKSFQDMCERILELEEKTEKQAQELNEIKAMSMFEFANKYCNDDQLTEAGHQLARALGVGQ